MITEGRVTLAIAAITLVVAYLQLNSANNALDANNAFLVESTLIDQAVSALEALNTSDGTDASNTAVINASLRLEGTLIVAKTLHANKGLSEETWNAILDTQCRMLGGNFEFFPILEAECAAK